MRRPLVFAAFAVAIAVVEADAAAALEVLAPPVEAPTMMTGPRALLAPRLTRVLLDALRNAADVQVLDARRVEAEVGLGLADRARRCNRDLLCLVQLGEVANADRIFLTELSEDPRGDFVLRALVIDVARASMVDTLRWTTPGEPRVLEQVGELLVRHLFARPDAQVVLDVEPHDATLELFGEVASLALGAQIPLWSGTYYARVSRPGYESRALKFSVPPGGPTRVTIPLAPDPLYVGPQVALPAPSGGGSAAPKDSRTTMPDPRPPPTATLPTVPTTPLGPGGRPMASRPFAARTWVALGVGALGAGAVAAGAVQLAAAQSSYNALAEEPRFDGGLTTSVGGARAAREDAEARYGVGTAVLVGGFVGLGGSLVWLLVDALTASSAPADVAHGPGGATWRVTF
jgi:hypothetical protein